MSATLPDPQAVAADPALCAWVEANAGSGKTKVLIDRVARLLLRGASPDSILCVTYTKAAASEMQARLFERLGAWCVMAADPLRSELGMLEGRNPDAYTQAEIAAARELFARALETPGGLRIETIHAFCGRVLRRFPLEAGTPPGFQELDADEALALRKAALRTLGARVLAGDGALGRAAATAAAAGGNVAAILGAIDPHRLAIQRFLEAAGGVQAGHEVIRRITAAPAESVDSLVARAMGPDLPRRALALAAQAFAGGAKTDKDQAQRLERALSDAPADERLQHYRAVMFTSKGEMRAPGKVFTKATGQNHPVLAELFDTGVPQGSELLRLEAVERDIRARSLFERSAALIELAAPVFSAFDSAKRARAGLDFDDLIEHTLELLSTRSAADWVLWKLDGGIAHILLDEAQDTSPRQWAILNKLGEDIFAGHGREREAPRTWFVVGDQKQSIYSFQGADPEHFIGETQQFSRRAAAGGIAAAQPSLARSFRSTPEVLAFVDETFNPDRFGGGAPFSLAPPTEADQPRHSAHRAQEAGCVEFWPLEPAPQNEKPDPWDAPRGQDSAAYPKQILAQRIARRIQHEIRTCRGVWQDGKMRPARPGDYLLLVRGRGGGLFDALLQALKREGLPVAGADRIQLLESLPVQDMLNLMRFALCRDDDLTVAEILKGPFCGLTDDDLIALAPGRAGSLLEALEASREPRHSRAASFLHMLMHQRALAPFEFLCNVLEAAPPDGAGPGWERLLRRFGMPAREPVAALMDRAAASDGAGPSSLQLFLDEIESRGGEVTRELSGPGDTVRVMTVHGAKGLEAPVVFLPDTVAAPSTDKEGLFLSPEGAPLWVGPKTSDIPLTAQLRQVAEQKALREHRRLLYVALTRARDRLVICGAAGKRAPGRDKDSWHALCEAGMNALLADGRATEDLDPQGRVILRLGPTPPEVSERTVEVGTEAPPAWLNLPALVPPAAARVLSASALGAGDPPALAPFGPGRAARLKRGRLIHRLLEVLPDCAPEDRAAAGERMLSRERDLTTEARMEMLQAALGLIEDESLSDIFAPGGRAEAPVVGRLGPDIINGRVDRMVVGDREILIVDFKSDRPAPARIADVGESYLLQMAAYRAVLRDAWPGRAVRCLLLWTDGPKVMELPGEMMDQALARRITSRERP